MIIVIIWCIVRSNVNWLQNSTQELCQPSCQDHMEIEALTFILQVVQEKTFNFLISCC